MIKSLSKNYEYTYNKLSFLNEQEDEEEIRCFLDLISHKERLKILDMGCAEGKLAVALALKGHKVTAADISSGYLKRVKNLFREKKREIRKAGGALTVLKCNIEKEKPRYSDLEFDVIYFMDVIEHLKNPIDALDNLRNILKDGGILILNTPNCLRLGRFIRNLFHKKYKIKDINALHFQCYDYLQLDIVLSFVGFEIQKTIPNVFPVPVLSRYRWWDKSCFPKFLARLFPRLSENLLIVAKKSLPLDIKKIINHFSNKYQE